MSVKITYFVHGTTVDNQKYISSSARDVGISDYWQLGWEYLLK